MKNYNVFNMNANNIMNQRKSPNNYYDNYNTNLQEENKKLKQELNIKNKLLDDYRKKIFQLEKTIKDLKNHSNNNNKQNNIRRLTYNNPSYSQNVNNNNIFEPFRELSNFGFENDFNVFTDNFFKNPFDFYSNGNSRGVRSKSNYNHINNNNNNIGNNNRKKIGFDARDYEEYYENNFTNENDEFERDIIDQLYPNPDRMTYEQLLDLEDKVGNVSKGLTKNQINKIPNIYFSKKKFRDQDKCAVCQYEYKEIEKVSKLPCGHIFHIDCIKGWLDKNKVCPICKKEIKIK